MSDTGSEPGCMRREPSATRRQPSATRQELSATRRALLSGLAGAVAAASAGELLLEPPAASGAEPSDAELLLPLVGTEMVAVLAYQQAIASRLLSAAGQRLAGSLLVHEHVHVAQLRAALIRLGGTPPQPPANLSQADQVLAANRITISLTHLHDAHDTIILLAEVEFLLEDSFRHAISRLRDPRALLLCVRTMAVEAQHGVALSELLHPGDVKKAVPSSFV